MNLTSCIEPRVRIRERRPAPSVIATSYAQRPGLEATLAAAVRRFGLDGSTELMNQHAAVRLAAEELARNEHRIIRAIVRRRPKGPLPTWAEWVHRAAPACSHREGDLLFLVVPAENANMASTCNAQPLTPGELVSFSRLIVVELPVA